MTASAFVSIVESPLDRWLADHIAPVHEMHLSLEHLQPWVSLYQLSSLPMPVIMVAGTNGKGSVVRCLESMYTRAGYRVLSYTSPHLLTAEERIRLNEQPVSSAILCGVCDELYREAGHGVLSYFEILTLAALKIARSEEVDVCLLEVGLGGRLDAVNVVDADVGVITNISLDHMAILGDSREAIAVEKAGIMRRGQICICADPSPPVSLQEAAVSAGVHWVPVSEGYQYSVTTADWNWEMRGGDGYSQLPHPPIWHQNAAAALAALTSLQDRLPVDRMAIEEGIAGAHILGRRECRDEPRLIVLDVAHNPASGEVLAEYLLERWPDKCWWVVVGMLRDKSIRGTLQPLCACVDQWWTVELGVERAWDAEGLRGEVALFSGESCYTGGGVAETLERVCRECPSDYGILVLGSFHTVGQAMQALDGV